MAGLPRGEADRKQAPEVRQTEPMCKLRRCVLTMLHRPPIARQAESRKTVLQTVNAELTAQQSRSSCAGLGGLDTRDVDHQPGQPGFAEDNETEKILPSPQSHSLTLAIKKPLPCS